MVRVRLTSERVFLLLTGCLTSAARQHDLEVTDKVGYLIEMLGIASESSSQNDFTLSRVFW